MNEEYFIYHRNFFSRLWHALMDVRQSVIAHNEAETQRKLARRQADLMAMKDNYNKDRDRAEFLNSRLSNLRDRISDCQSRLDSEKDNKNSEQIRSEIRRLNGAIRRRSTEYQRVSASISDILERANCSRMSIAISL